MPNEAQAGRGQSPGELASGRGPYLNRELSWLAFNSRVLSLAEDPDRPGTLLARASGEIEVSRLAFGIGQGEWRDISVVSDTVVIRIEIVARRPKSGK